MNRSKIAQIALSFLISLNVLLPSQPALALRPVGLEEAQSENRKQLERSLQSAFTGLEENLGNPIRQRTARIRDPGHPFVVSLPLPAPIQTKKHGEVRFLPISFWRDKKTKGWFYQRLDSKNQFQSTPHPIPPGPEGIYFGSSKSLFGASKGPKASNYVQSDLAPFQIFVRTLNDGVIYLANLVDDGALDKRPRIYLEDQQLVPPVIPKETADVATDGVWLMPEYVSSTEWHLVPTASDVFQKIPIGGNIEIPLGWLFLGETLFLRLAQTDEEGTFLLSINVSILLPGSTAVPPEGLGQLVSQVKVTKLLAQVPSGEYGFVGPDLLIHKLFLGRDTEHNDVVISAPSTSRRHATLEIKPYGVQYPFSPVLIVQELEAQYGTFFNLKKSPLAGLEEKISRRERDKLHNRMGRILSFRDPAGYFLIGKERMQLHQYQVAGRHWQAAQRLNQKYTRTSQFPAYPKIAEIIKEATRRYRLNKDKVQVPEALGLLARRIAFSNRSKWDPAIYPKPSEEGLLVFFSRFGDPPEKESISQDTREDLMNRVLTQKIQWPEQENLDISPRAFTRAFEELEATLREIPRYAARLRETQSNGNQVALAKASIAKTEHRSLLEALSELHKDSLTVVDQLIKLAPQKRDQPIGPGTTILVEDIGPEGEDKLSTDDLESRPVYNPQLGRMVLVPARGWTLGRLQDRLVLKKMKLSVVSARKKSISLKVVSRAGKTVKEVQSRRREIRALLKKLAAPDASQRLFPPAAGLEENGHNLNGLKELLEKSGLQLVPGTSNVYRAGKRGAARIQLYPNGKYSRSLEIKVFRKRAVWLMEEVHKELDTRYLKLHSTQGEAVWIRRGHVDSSLIQDLRYDQSRYRPETPGLLSPGMNGRPERSQRKLSWRSEGKSGVIGVWPDTGVGRTRGIGFSCTWYGFRNIGSEYCGAK